MIMVRSLALALLLPLVLACDAKPAPPKPAVEEAEPVARAPAPKQDPHANPEPLAAAPAGAVAIGRVYVQTCADAKACPALLQDAGVAHCKALGQGGLLWRLPTLAELEAWRGNPALVGYDVFHWSGSAWDEDPTQFWIYDPGSGAKTTAKPDRKPFTIRCVA
jgi:hypothetical protein